MPKSRRNLQSRISQLKRQLNRLDQRKKLWETEIIELTDYLWKTQVPQKRDKKGKFTC